MSNIELWDSVCQTDPSHTKKFTKGGGFSGTAIKPIYIIRKATEKFGPVGIGWGFTELEHEVVGGVWCSKVEVWYNYNNQRGTIQQWGQTVMQGKNKNGDFVDEEAPKKSMTDALTKCLSYLGFSGDVHMGLFDDHKYVEGLERKETKAAMKKRFTELKEDIATSADPAATWSENMKEINEFLEQDKTFYDELVKTGATRKAELEQIEGMQAGMPQGFNDIKREQDGE